MMVQQWE